VKQGRNYNPDVCGQVMFLNGTPSAGKSTLATAMQTAAPGPLFYRSLDDFLDGYPRRVRETDATLFNRVMVGYLRSLRELAGAGIDLVAEAVIVPDRVPLYVETFRDSRVLLVGVRCPLGIAEERERARTDRRLLRLDVPEFELVHAIPYDLEVDAGKPSETERSVKQLVGLFYDPPERRAFERLVASAS
jgi:chloramphenicol 3-O phosphotransferase